MNTLLMSAMVSADSIDLDTNTVTPGVLGFLAVFAIGVALYFLMRDMTGKLRGLSVDEAEDRDGGEAEAADAPADTRPRT